MELLRDWVEEDELLLSPLFQPGCTDLPLYNATECPVAFAAFSALGTLASVTGLIDPASDAPVTRLVTHATLTPFTGDYACACPNVAYITYGSAISVAAFTISTFTIAAFTIAAFTITAFNIATLPATTTHTLPTGLATVQ